MSTLPSLAIALPRFELRFAPLSGADGGVAVPCDEEGAVDLDELDDTTRESYFYAHTLIGRDFAHPVVRCVGIAIG